MLRWHNEYYAVAQAQIDADGVIDYSEDELKKKRTHVFVFPILHVIFLRWKLQMFEIVRKVIIINLILIFIEISSKINSILSPPKISILI